MKKLMTGSIAALALAATLLPSIAGAQSSHRQAQKDQWKNIAIGAGALGIIGALTHNDTLTFGGLAGAAYAAYRYDADGNCYGQRYDRDHRRYEWVRVPDRDRHNDRYRDRDRDWDQGRNNNDWNRARNDSNWNRGRNDNDWNHGRNDNDWNRGRNDNDWNRGRNDNSRNQGRGNDRDHDHHH